VLAVVGRNGMGKTTLCKTIMGLVRASSGSIRYGNEELTQLSPAQIARLGIGYVPQGRRLWRSLTVDEHLRMLAGARRGAWNIERLYDTFPRLAERRNNAGGDLSGGEQQMLAISRALIGNPRLLVMDEPTEGLAPVIIDELLRAFKVIQEHGTALVLVEQHIRMVQHLASRFVALGKGRVVSQGPVSELETRAVQELIAL
jgi:ABC-type branched-subunit amino acid transport system ATPase component